MRIVLTLLFGVGAIVFLGACDDVAGVSSYYDAFTQYETPEDQAANATGRTGDSTADGMLGALSAVNKIREADGLASSAVIESNAGNTERAGQLIDQAIRERPDDMRYRRTAASVALKGSDTETARQQWAEQDRIASEQGQAAHAWYWQKSYEDAAEDAYTLLNSVHAPTAKAAQKAQGVLVYTRMAECLEKAADINTENLEIDAAAEQMRQAEICRGLARDFE
jgi:hypothetical protein